MSDIPVKLHDEIESFKTLWHGGFRTGYSVKRNQRGIESYIRDNMHGSNVLEIGCGGGQWSKFIYLLNRFDRIHCVDILSAEHNRFWEYVGPEKVDKITYTQVHDFSLSHIPDESIDYVFSYDVFCHISKTGQNEYLKTLSKKCKPGAKLFIMYADAAKYCPSEPENIMGHVKPPGFSGNLQQIIQRVLDDCDGAPYPGRWYWVGIENFIKMCTDNGFTVLERDLDIDKTNPITLFTK